MTIRRAYTVFCEGLLVCLLALSLFWCGDPGCMAQSGFDRCGAPSAAAGMHELVLRHDDCAAGCDCSCVCHVPMVAADRYTAGAALVPVFAPIPRIFCRTAATGKFIFHPPRA